MYSLFSYHLKNIPYLLRLYPQILFEDIHTKCRVSNISKYFQNIDGTAVTNYLFLGPPGLNKAECPLVISFN